MRVRSTGSMALVLAVCAAARPASALPTMVRLGYTNCVACHIAPQGGGLLNLYGRGIDEAQSLRAGEYVAPGDGRVIQDVRWVTQEQMNTTEGAPWTGLLRSRLFYRNATEIGKGFRVSATFAIENEAAPRPRLPYEPNIVPRVFYESSSVALRGYLTTALLSDRVSKSLEISLGRDQLPTGVNIADLSTFVRSRNRVGYYDSPVQMKLAWWGKRYQVMPYVFAPGGVEPSNARESGGGSLLEIDALGNGRTIVGTNILRGWDGDGHRSLIGPYIRLGFGRWGILGEHDITERASPRFAAPSFQQTASYGQLFWAGREWLVLSMIGERLKVESPFPEELVAGKFEVAARLTSSFTVTSGARLQRNIATGRLTPSVTLQVAMKPVTKPVW